MAIRELKIHLIVGRLVDDCRDTTMILGNVLLVGSLLGLIEVCFVFLV